MPLKINIDADSIASQFKEFMNEVRQDIQQSIGNLATLTRTRIVEKVNKELHTSRKSYMDALSDAEEVTPGLWVISLDESAIWIEEGIEPNKDMKPSLLKGKKHRVIPFRYDRGASQNPPFTQGLISEIKQTLKKDKLSISKIEYNKDGSPRLGKLHEYNLGGPKPGKGNTGALQRLTIYQREQAGKIKREVLTFRTVSSGEASIGKWIHPGLTAKKFMDRAMDEATRDWEEQILPEIMNKWSSK